MVRIAVILTGLLCSACMFAKQGAPTVDVNAQVATQYNFRGQVMTDRPVLQAETAVQLPTRDGGAVVLRGWGNLDLTEGSGRSWFDDGHQGEFTEIDLSAAYARTVSGVDLSAGVLHYSWAHGETFPRGRFAPTSEAFVRVGGEVAGLRPALTVHRDFDAAEGWYLRGELGHEVPLAEGLHLNLLGWQGWSDAEHSFWLYRTGQSAWADLGGSITLGWDLDEVTQLRVGVAGSTIVDQDLRSWFQGKIDPDNVWFTVGMAWAL